MKNLRDWGLPLGRRFRALKLWFLIREQGVEGAADAAAPRSRQRAVAGRRRSARAPDWRVLAPVPLQTVCVRHEPPGLEGEALDRHTLAWVERGQPVGRRLSHAGDSGWAAGWCASRSARCHRARTCGGPVAPDARGRARADRELTRRGCDVWISRIVGRREGGSAWLREGRRPRRGRRRGSCSAARRLVSQFLQRFALKDVRIVIVRQ